LQAALDTRQGCDGIAVGGGACDDLAKLQDGKAVAGASDLEGGPIKTIHQWTALIGTLLLRSSF